MRRHAEIAGGGIGGLGTAMMLASRGWSVRLHERSPEIREIGAGIYIKNNAIEVLEELGIFDRLKPQGLRLERSQVLDRDGRVMQDRELGKGARVYAFLRQSLVEALRDGALRGGVEIVTASSATAADPAGALLLENGSRLRADLVIAADGVRSRVRDSLAVGARHRLLPTTVNRYLVPSREIAPDLITREHWSDRYRIGITPCGAEMSYVYQVFPQSDRAAGALPNDIGHWSRAFPRLRRVFELLAEIEPHRHSYSIVECPRWQRGRVAIIGDAAHGLPPTLGQGVGLTLMNARALAALLASRTDIAEALGAWESAVRSISDRTQRWALRYDYFTRQWPPALWFVRPAIIWAFRSVPALNRRMRVADRGLKATALGSL